MTRLMKKSQSIVRDDECTRMCSTSVQSVLYWRVSNFESFEFEFIPWVFQKVQSKLRRNYYFYMKDAVYQRVSVIFYQKIIPCETSKDDRHTKPSTLCHQHFQTAKNVYFRQKLHKSTLKYTQIYTVNYKNSIIAVIKSQKNIKR